MILNTPQALGVGYFTHRSPERVKPLSRGDGLVEDIKGVDELTPGLGKKKHAWDRLSEQCPYILDMAKADSYDMAEQTCVLGCHHIGNIFVIKRSAAAESGAESSYHLEEKLNGLSIWLPPHTRSSALKPILSILILKAPKENYGENQCTLGNKKQPRLSGKPALIARFTFQELHIQTVQQRRWERRVLKTKEQRKKSLPEEKLHAQSQFRRSGAEGHTVPVSPSERSATGKIIHKFGSRASKGPGRAVPLPSGPGQCAPIRTCCPVKQTESVHNSLMGCAALLDRGVERVCHKSPRSEQGISSGARRRPRGSADEHLPSAAALPRREQRGQRCLRPCQQPSSTASSTDCGHQSHGGCGHKASPE
ncbi:hypothetical protein Anapl_17483 [Anas platyrhynchos]|uniref:Uncharacterized protein n=1 Tax=Anas platyrhynchos TaxID=8839 RepID=R0M1X7_ANAPL|nr:hypothetical protein Anapl_17483 [Anas platyrhynchos]